MAWNPPFLLYKAYSHVRVMFLLYAHDPADLSTTDYNILNTSADVTFPALGDGLLAGSIKALANGPSIGRGNYTNVSNIYGIGTGFGAAGPYDAWVTWATANGVNIEDAFLHSASPVSSANRWPSQYGTTRPVTNVSNANFRTWALQYYPPLVTGTNWNWSYMDNCGTVWSTGNNPPSPIVETFSNTQWVADHGTLMQGIAEANRNTNWLLNIDANPQTQELIAGYPGGWPIRFDEELYRVVTDFTNHFTGNYQTFLRRQALAPSSTAYAFCDISAVGYSGGFTAAAGDPVMQMSGLAYYHMMSDPQYTFLSLWGGDVPSMLPSVRWFNAIATNIGLPLGAANLSWVPSVTDPSAPTRSSFVARRDFSLDGTTISASVFYKPVSFAAPFDPGVWNAGPTTHNIGMTGYVLNHDGTSGPQTSTITLANGNGVIVTAQSQGGGGGSTFSTGVFGERWNHIFGRRRRSNAA